MNKLRDYFNREKVLIVLRIWVPMAVSLSLLLSLVYLLIQQTIRLGANYPQVQIAEDIAGALQQNGRSPELSAFKTVELSQSLSPFVMLYDAKGQLTSSTAVLDGQIRPIPPGVLDYSRKFGTNRVTWQPKTGVREAIVVVHYSGKNTGFVVAGRSLKEAERLIDNITVLALLGWVAIMAISIILAVIFQFLF